MSHVQLGALRHITLENGVSVPFYVIPFDKQGVCTGPETQQLLVDDVHDGRYTDIFLFSHGWNNDWQTALAGYENFQRGFMQMRQHHTLPLPEPYHPLMVGIFWPSTALVFGEQEVGPDFAGEDALTQALDELTTELSAAQATRLHELVGKQNLTEEEAQELAKIGLTIYRAHDDELQLDEPLTAEGVLAVWKKAMPVFRQPGDNEASTKPGVIDFDRLLGPQGGSPGAAGGIDLSVLDPRNVVRVLTVYQMKDRAGAVGTVGVGPLLKRLLEAGNGRMHLIGHSYGCKVLLSALCQPAVLARPVDSMLLLEPAVNHLCFAAQVPETTTPGGYHKALTRVRLPILSTYSLHDKPLHDFFHLALRRPSDLGEVQIAAEGEPPSRFAALGGYGPRHSGEQLMAIHAFGDVYDLNPAIKLIGLNGAATIVDGKAAINGHGDISNESTWWALYELVRTRQ